MSMGWNWINPTTACLLKLLHKVGVEAANLQLERGIMMDGHGVMHVWNGSLWKRVETMAEDRWT